MPAYRCQRARPKGMLRNKRCRVLDAAGSVDDCECPDDRPVWQDEETTAAKVRAFRAKHGLTQKQLATVLGICSKGQGRQNRTVAAWEAGEREPPAYLMLALEALEARRTPLVQLAREMEGKNG